MNKINNNPNSSDIQLLDLVSYGSKDYLLMNGKKQNVEGIVLGIIRGMDKPFSIQNTFLELQSEFNGEYYYDVMKIDDVKLLETSDFYNRYPQAEFLSGWPKSNVIIEVNDKDNKDKYHKGIIVSTQISIGLDKLSIKLYDMNNIFDTIELLEYAAYTKFLKQTKNMGFDSQLFFEETKNKYIKNEIVAFLNTEKYHDSIRPHKDNKVLLIEEYLENLI